MKVFLRGIVVAVLAILAMPPMSGAESWTVPDSYPSQVFARGDGSASDPYVIQTAQQLANFAYMVYWCYDYYEGKYIVLGNDIVLNDNVMADPSGARPWMPIGSEGSFKDGKFYGTFDGRGHTIYGLYIDHTSTISGYAGLFGTIKGDGVVRNVNVKDAVIDLRQFTRHNLFVGGIVGYTSDNARVEDCSFQGYIYSVDYSKYQGGIVGYHNSTKPISDCHAEGKMENGKYNAGDVPIARFMGGIAGYSYSQVINCTAAVNMVGSYAESSNVNYLGGVVAYCDADVVNCITLDKDSQGNSIVISGEMGYSVGGVVGYAQTVSHCRNYAEVAWLNDYSMNGGVVGQCTTVEYCANFGKVRFKDPSRQAGMHLVCVGGVVGLASYVRYCVNYGYMDFADGKQSYDKGDTKYAWYGGIAGRSYYTMTGCLSVGEIRFSQFTFKESSISDTSYGVCSYESLTPENTYWLDTREDQSKVIQASPSGDGSMKTNLEYLQSVDYLNSCTAFWGMTWGLDMTTKYPLPILWGGVDRDFALSVEDGDGSEANPYIISSVESFRAMNSQLYNSSDGLKGKYFKQVADLDFTGEEFMPLGLYYLSEYDTYVTHNFQGHYDGGGHTVRNITFDCDAAQNVGFIAQMTGEGTLKNLNFSNVSFTVSGGNVGIALGAYTTSEATARTPLSGINVLACNILANGDAIVGGLAGIVATEGISSATAPILTIEGCTAQATSIDASYRAGGLVGAVANVAINHSTAVCDFKVNNSYTTTKRCAGGLVGTVGFNDTRTITNHNYYNAVFQADYCAILPIVDFASATAFTGYDGSSCYFGGISGFAEHGSNRLVISHSFVDFACFIDDMLNVYSGYAIGTAESATFKFNYVEFPELSSYSLGGSLSVTTVEEGSLYNTFDTLGGWDAYFLNGCSNTGDMKWGYYYPTATPNPYAVTSANGKYANFSSHYSSQITAPERLYVDFTLPAVPLDNNVLTAAEGTSISQILVAAKANLVSQNGVASRLYLHDNMDFKYNGSFQAYTVHFAVENGAKCQVMCLPFEVRREMLPEGSLMLAIDGYTASAVTSKVIYAAAAGTPFILYNANGVVIDDSSYDGIVTGATGFDTYLSGTFAATTASAGDYVLSADGSKFVRLTDAADIAAFRGYVPAANFPEAGDEVPFIIEADKFADLTTAGAVYKLNFPLYGVRVHDGVLYATTAEQSADISKPIEGLPMQDFESVYWCDNDQFDWIAIPGLGSEYVGKALNTGFVAQYTGDQLTNAANYSVAGDALSINLSTYTSAHILHGNYTNYADDDYHGFFVAPKTNEVARFYGYVSTDGDGVRYLTLEEEWCGLLNGKGVVIEGATAAAMPDNTETYQAFEG
ncbi:MAG: hypothetical protein ACI4AM_00780, partial [Muribaculaceae bacterium]